MIKVIAVISVYQDGKFLMGQNMAREFVHLRNARKYWNTLCKIVENIVEKL